MNMNIKNEYRLFQKVLRSYLDESKINDSTVKIREQAFIDAGMSRAGIAFGLTKSQEEGIVIGNQVMYAPKRSVPTRPVKWPSHVTPYDEIYDVPVYFLRLDATKLLNPQARLPKVYYNEKNAFGFTDDKKFKFTNKSHAQVFAALYQNPGVAIPRGEILHIYGKEGLAHKAGTIFINDMATQIRRRAKLGEKYLQVRNSSFTLICDRISHPPK